MAEKIRVLYVDDERDLLELGKMYLEQSGDFTVTTITNAPDAIRVLEQEKFDTVISDYQMPGMDGIQFLIEVRTRFGPVPFILFTGKGREEVVIQAINSGADFYLQKGGEPKAQFAELSHKIKAAASRKRADDALRKSEEKYRHLIEHSNEAILVAQDGMLKLVNHRFAELLGYSEQELLSTQFPMFIHPDDRALVMERYQKRLKGEKLPSRYPFRLNPKNGNILWVEISAVVVDWDGRPATLNFLTDITERKQADDSLRDEQQFSKLLLDSLPGIFYLYTYPENRMVLWNKQHETLLGYTADEIKGKLGTDLHLPEHKDAVLKAIDEVMKKGQSSVESTLLAKDGRLIPFYFTGVRFEAHGQLYFMGIGIDITGRKLAEEALQKKNEELYASYEQITATEEELRGNLDELARQERALRESEQRFDLAVEGTGAGLWDWDMAHDRVVYSVQWKRMLGYDDHEIENSFSGWKNLWHPDDGANIEKTIDDYLTGKTEHYEIIHRLRHKDGSWRWIVTRGRIIKDSTGKPVRWIGTNIDITERKKAEEKIIKKNEELNVAYEQLTASEEELRQNYDDLVRSQNLLMEREERYRAVSGTTTDFAFSCVKYEGGTYSIDWMDGAVERITGYTIDEMVALGCWKCIVLPDDASVFDENIINLPLGISRTCQLRIRTKSGTKRWLAVNTTHVPTKDKASSDRVFGGCRDITEHKLAEEALTHSHDLMRYIIEHSRSAIAVHDRDLKYLYVSQRYLQEYKVKDRDIIGKHHYDVFPDLPQKWRDVHQKALAGEISSAEDDPYVREDGSVDWTRWECRPWYEDDGSIGGIIVYTEVITERKQAELELASALESLKEAHHLAHIGTWDWVKEQDTVIWSKELYNIFGRDTSLPAPTYAEHPRFYTPSSWDRLNSAVMRALTTGEPYNLELELIRQDGSIRWTNAFGGAKCDADRNIIGLHGTVQDITERKLAAEALQQANKKLNLLSSITRHDINNQLTVLQGYLSLLETKQSAPKLNEYLHKVTIAAERIASMIQFTKEYENIGITAPVWQEWRTVVDAAKKGAPLGQVLVKNDLPAGTEVFADPLVEKVFYNLMDNAVRYGGKITIIRFSTEKRNGDHLIVCEDDGVGVPAEEKEKIFERGFGKNTGLGLALSREILSMTGITIAENGTPGKGARFEMTVPTQAYRFGDTRHV